MKLTVCRPIRADGTLDDKPYLIDARSNREVYDRDFPVSPSDRKLIANVLMGMMRRCYDSDTIGFHRWGGRGISICDEWYDKKNRKLNKKAFIIWAVANGWKKGLQIDRIDNNKNYEPSNCRFVSSRENNRNRCDTHYITHDGETMCMKAWAEKTGIPYYELNMRINIYHWDVHRALTTPLMAHERIEEMNGERKSISEWARCYGIKRDVVKDRMASGWSLKDALTKEKLSRHERLIEYNGERKNIKDWCLVFGLPYRCVLNRMNRGWSIDKVFNTQVDTRFGTRKKQ